jgi:hypothetical protein
MGAWSWIINFPDVLFFFFMKVIDETRWSFVNQAIVQGAHDG